MTDLHLNLKGEYFDEIKSGEKKEEYRLVTDYWKKRLVDKKYKRILIKKGYPAREDEKRVLVRPWRGYNIKTFTHSFFGDKPVTVFAIKVNK